MFQPIDRIELYGGEGYVELWPSWYANQSQETRVEVVSKIATLSYGNDAAKNPQQLYDTLRQSKHSSVFEFVVNNEGRNLRTSMTMPIFLPRNTTDFIPLSLEDVIDITKCQFSLFKIKIPIFVMRQFVRHRNHSILEMSRRYVKDSKRPFEFYKYEEDKAYYDVCTAKYQSALASGMLAQEARKYIPVGAYTELFWMNNWNPISGMKNMMELRLDKQHTQAETVEMTEAMYELIKKHQPTLFNQIKIGDI